MTPDGAGQLESALTSTLECAERASSEVKALASAVSSARRAATEGDLRALRRSLARAEEAVGAAASAVAELTDSWPYDEEREVELLASGDYQAELLAEAQTQGLAIHELDGTLSSYPSIVRLAPRQLAVTIDRKPFRQLRPSRLVRHLQALQSKEPRLSPERFIETLHSAYRLLAERPGAMVSLIAMYRVLTLLPGVSRDYSQQEFARDVYLLDRSGHSETRSGAHMYLSAGSSAARSPRQLLRVVTRDGREQTYYGVEFTEGD